MRTPGSCHFSKASVPQSWGIFTQSWLWAELGAEGALQLIAAFPPLEETLFCGHYALSIWQSGLETLCFHLASEAGEQLSSTEGKAF